MGFPKELTIGQTAERIFKIEKREAIDVENRTVEIAFSSEEPYERHFGIEILDHSTGSVDMSRMKNSAPFLVMHDHDDQVGVIESARIDADRVGRAIVRFGKSKRAEEIFQDVIDGIRSKISVGYRINDVVLESERDGLSTYRVMKWQPHEASIVSVAADDRVGVGRSAEKSATHYPEIQIKGSKMPDEIEAKAQEALRSLGADAEHKRVSEILNTANAYSKFDLAELATEAVKSKMSVAEFNQKAMEKMSSAPKPMAEIGMKPDEVKKYSMLRALSVLANPGDRKIREAGAFEIECSEAAAQRAGKSAQGLMVPYDVLTRDLLVGTATAGGHTVATELQAASFIDLLRNAQIINRMGATMLTGLNGNIAIPRQTSGATAYWVAENGASTESQQAFDQVAMSPKTVGAFTDMSRKLLLQSSIDVEAFVQKDLATVLGLAIQAAAIKGGGSNEPTGILSTVGIGNVIGGTNGLAPTWAHAVDLESAVAVANADVGTLGYLVNAKTRGVFKKTFKNGAASPSIWDNGNTPLNGYQAGVTNAVPSNLVKGSSGSICSAILFGNWADLIIGYWGGLDLLVDPYTGGAAGTVRVRVLQDVDVAVRHPESFAAMLDALA